MTTLKDYTKKAAIDYTPTPDIVVASVKLDSKKDILSYTVPELTPDGTCNIEEKLADEPYDLRPILGIRTTKQEKQTIEQLAVLHGLLAGTQKKLKADWIGIYQSSVNKYGVPVLVKLAYQGAPSRAEFPLTESFAELSNNSTVGLSGKGVVIKSVKEHQGAYYVCDGKVNSEACLPIYDKSMSRVIGIVDAEAFDDGHFAGKNLALVAKLCQQLSEYLPLRIN